MSKIFKEKKDGPTEILIKAVVENGFLKGKSIGNVTRMLNGNTTFVYRIETEKCVYYARLLPNDGRFNIELILHSLLIKNDINVPQILWFEEENAETGLSLMIMEEMPGKSVEDNYPSDECLKAILRNAGEQLARINQIDDINGFGVFDTHSSGILVGEKENFDDYYFHCFESCLDVLTDYPFSADERVHIRKTAENARKNLHTEKPALVFGDFSLDHIFHKDGKFTGFIDLGKACGNNRLYDLGYITGFYQNRKILSCLLEGYRLVDTVNENDLVSIEYAAFSVILKMLAIKTNTNRRLYWYELMKRQLHAGNIL